MTDKPMFYPWGHEKVLIDGVEQPTYFKIEGGRGYFDPENPELGFGIYGFMPPEVAKILGNSNGYKFALEQLLDVVKREMPDDYWTKDLYDAIADAHTALM